MNFSVDFGHFQYEILVKSEIKLHYKRHNWTPEIFLTKTNDSIEFSGSENLSRQIFIKFEEKKIFFTTLTPFFQNSTLCTIVPIGIRGGDTGPFLGQISFWGSRSSQLKDARPQS